jgi:hypothetical protein
VSEFMPPRSCLYAGVSVSSSGRAALATPPTVTSTLEVPMETNGRPRLKTRPPVDVTGQRFGRWLVLRCWFKEPDPAAKFQWRRMWADVRCDCGTLKSVAVTSLRSGHTTSCGRCHGWGRAFKHGESSTRLHRIWRGMRNRTTNPNVTHYRNYGGKGVQVCEEWRDFIVFRDWALAHGYADDLTIERIDSRGDYEPANCEWITGSENARRGAVKLSERDAWEIPQLWATGEWTRTQLGVEFDVDRVTITRVLDRRTWHHIEGVPRPSERDHPPLFT